MTWARCCRREMRDSVVMRLLMVMKSYRFVGSIYQQWRCPAGSSEVGVGKNWSAMDLVLLPAALNGWRRWWRLGVEIRQKFSDGEREKARLSTTYRGVGGWSISYLRS